MPPFDCLSWPPNCWIIFPPSLFWCRWRKIYRRLIRGKFQALNATEIICPLSVHWNILFLQATRFFRLVIAPVRMAAVDFCAWSLDLDFSCFYPFVSGSDFHNKVNGFGYVHLSLKKGATHRSNRWRPLTSWICRRCFSFGVPFLLSITPVRVFWRQYVEIIRKKKLVDYGRLKCYGPRIKH